MALTQDLESAIDDAALMAWITVEFVGQALHVDEPEGPPLTKEARTQLMFAVLDTCMRIEKASKIFHGD